MMTNLIPTNGRKSFYGKAIVKLCDDGSKILYSYGTPIVKRCAGGSLVRLYDDNPSNTTCSHIISFCGLHKSEFIKLDME